MDRQDWKKQPASSKPKFGQRSASMERGWGGGGEARFVDCHSHNTHLGIASESEAAFGVGAWDGMGADFKGIGKIAGVGMGDSKT